MAYRVVASGYGGPEVLKVEEFEPQALPAGHVRVEVRAAAVNPYDAKSYSGMMSSDPSKLPILLGFEASGFVSEVAEDVTTGPSGEINFGDEVIVYRATAAYSDQVIAPASSILRRPSRLTFEQASGLMLTGVTAVHTMVATNVSDGETVLIHGAAGGVGLMAIQLATARGAHVIGTASPSQHELLQEFGVTPVAYGDGLADRVRAIGNVDAAIDLVGTDEAIDVSLELVHDKSRIATIANFSRAPELGIQVLGETTQDGRDIRTNARLELLQLVEDGKLRVLVDEVFSLRDAAKAHEAIAAGHSHGKIVLTP